MKISANVAFTFEPFALDPARRVLLEAGRQVRIGGRAFDILAILVERAGEVVSKQELMERVWPRSLVEESNLRVHITILRKRLRDNQSTPRYIRSVSRRGYCFVAPVERRLSETSSPVALHNTSLTLPPVPRQLIARAETVAVITRKLELSRTVTILGPGGIGKTSVALAVAELLAPEYGDKLCFVDLSVIDDEALVPMAVATALGVTPSPRDPFKSLSDFARGARMLVILDNCEHVIEGAAQVLDRLLRSAPGIDLLATSREPLLVSGESVYRLDALRVPKQSSSLTAREARDYSAIELFVERATGTFEGFVLTDENVGDVAAICTRLDGLPLAIELVAARVTPQGIKALLSQLDGRLLLLSKGRRTASPRHQSLRAMLDWSYETLPEDEQTILRRIAVFRNAFTAEAAASVVSDAAIPTTAVQDRLLLLTNKSLITAEVSTDSISYRLLHTTRLYAFQLLELNPTELAQTRRRHAEYLHSVLTQAQTDWESVPRGQWMIQYAPFIDDVRAAIDWALSSEGDLTLGTELTAATLPFGCQLLSLGTEAVRA